MTKNINVTDTQLKSELERIDSMEKKHIPTTLNFRDVHPNLLQGLIVVDDGCFMGIDGDIKRHNITYFEYEDDMFLTNQISIKNLPLIHKAVNEAKKMGWMYVMMIMKHPAHDTDPDFKHMFIIRGC